MNLVVVHEMKDLCGDATTSNSQNTLLENIKSAANEDQKLFHALYSCQDVREDMDVIAWYESVKYKVPKFIEWLLIYFQFHLHKSKMTASFL
jgi:hypothetical protein